LKVLLVCNGFPPSGQWGTEYYAHQLSHGLLSRGAEVSVLYPVRDSERERFSLRRVDRDGLTVFELANAGDARKSFRDSYQCEGVERAFAELVERERPDVVHFLHLLWGLSIGLPAIANAAGARTIVTPTDLGLICHRGQLFNGRSERCEGAQSPSTCARCIREPGHWDAPALPSELRRIAIRSLASVGGAGRLVMARDIEARRDQVSLALQDVDHWIIPTRAMDRELRRSGIPVGPSTHLPYGIDEDLYSRKREPSSSVRFVYMSQYMPHKGLACLLDATRRLESQLPESIEEWAVQLHGNGGRARHRMYARELLRSLPRRVTDCGPFEPLRAPEVLARTDCVVVPSEWIENAPLTVLQARCAGVPVIASNVPGVAEVLENGKHGLLFEPGNSEDLARAMSKVINGELAHVQPDPLLLYGEHLDQVEAVYGHSTVDLAPHRAAMPEVRVPAL
jgi:glycosyltransferase involved in cell wall biosynthesis